MSPHAVISGAARDGKPAIDLSKFAVTHNAFLPASSPPTSLSDSYYEPWELIAQHLPTLIESNRIRDAVRDLAVLSTDGLVSEEEWRRAYVILAFIANAYIWGGEKPEQVSDQTLVLHDSLDAHSVNLDAPQILPPQITAPLLRVSSHLEVPPALTYAGANLWNFSCSGSDFADLDSLTLPISFTGTESEAWFLLISVAMEAKAAGILQTMMAALDAVKTRDYHVITSALGELRGCIEGVGALLERMHEKCDPLVFYHKIRPLLAGSMNMEASGLPKGVFYDQGSGKGQWRQYRGGSNGQSSLIQFFDVVLGVEHHTHGKPGQPSYHAEVREYMPGPHRRFLVHAARMGSIRGLALAEPTTDEQRRLRDAYAAATQALSEFRNKHIRIVTRYIVLPSRQPWTGGPRTNLASSSSSRKSELGLVGTGGTELIPFLRTSRDETCEAARLNKE
ncbi:indoleamine 2,3-dioxygenase pyrrole 2,3-dioxygenase [Metarhizium album ARSEF 1941]|uniref:Indoleamine 2,3-dioxygenase pyrrole 2,3-dioxygenase n=1 Tax=Metarhizium album (strain ARSEF 1941) TaxID=1081103 RepID=A0A0B2WMG7_METAS|nr:indoleamine 2,3-dioxygenase pyrrole 2,3-dioxygenase [Metarhizium album ARSEF 1941]KHN94682.1 indoleamine 2,3-dioxygenase pyrrole 2,3-dioxygenase [Metarhizium album ARSEF 1941]